MSAFVRFVLDQPVRLAMPLCTYPGAALIGASVRAMVTDAVTQTAAQLALLQRYPGPVALVSMDLSAEAEAFGCAVQLSDHEVPTVVGRCVSGRASVQALPVPEPGAGRTGVYLEVAHRLKKRSGARFVLGSMVGPFSLAGRLYGVSESLTLTVEDPGLMHLLVQKATQFLTAYARAFRAAGADGVLVAEPTAGLLSPRALIEFSSAYIKQIVAAVDDGQFTVILHNCAARPVHLAGVLQAGARVVHFGAPMDLLAALDQAPPDVVVCGNLDPARVFVNSTPTEVATAVQALLQATAGRRNFVLSSGCDVPPQTPVANLDAFYQAAAQARGRAGCTAAAS
jgi:uroporphyrinogen decarboxylase